MRCFLLLCCLALLPCRTVLADEPPRKILPVLVWTGTDSEQTKESFARCLSAEDWKASWQKHHMKERAEAPTCPEVDFTSYMVVVIFHGKSRQNHGIRVSDVLADGPIIRLRYTPTWYQIGFELGAGHLDFKKFETRSYAFIVLPRSTKAITLEEDVKRRIDESPIWKERVTFLAVEKK